MTDLVFTPAYQLAQMIRARQVSAVEVLEAHLAQINKHNETFPRGSIGTSSVLIGCIGISTFTSFPPEEYLFSKRPKSDRYFSSVK